MGGFSGYIYYYLRNDQENVYINNFAEFRKSWYYENNNINLYVKEKSLANLEKLLSCLI